jgi:glutamate racemase
MTKAPIGVFDSGVGGLSILRGIQQLLPAENLLYVADSAHAPYGPKGDVFIQNRCEVIMQFFVQQGVKAVVLACNTATAAAVTVLRQRYTLPLIGIEPAIKPAASLSMSGVVGVLATSGTITSDKFMSLQSRFEGEVKIITRACPGLVELIEQVEPDQKAIKKMLHGFISPMLDLGADTLVLGCTHYSLIRHLIREVAGADVTIVDADAGVAKELQRRLAATNMLGNSTDTGVIKFFTSGEVEQQNKLLQKYWGQPVLAASILTRS